jgi:hypothetical protein
MGIPVASICTTVFSKEAKNSASILKMPDFKVVEITHPLSTLTENEIRERAVEAAGQIIDIITGQNPDHLMGLYSIKRKGAIADQPADQEMRRMEPSVQTVQSCTDG